MTAEGTSPGSSRWALVKLKHVAPVQVNRLEVKPLDSIYVALENIEAWSGRLLLEEPLEVEGAVGQFRAGDILVGKLRPYLAKVARPTFDGVCSTELVVLRPTSKVLPEFLQYRLLTRSFIDEITSWSFGTKMPRVSPERLLIAEIALPTLDEQRAIVRYLDEETTQIDTLIEKKRRHIATSDEWLVGLIANAIPWTEEYAQDISSDWDTWKVGHAFRTIGSGTTPSATDLNIAGGNVPWVTTSELRETWVTETTRMINADLLAVYPALKVYPVGTLLIAMYGATIGRIGLLGIPACTNQACCALYGSEVLDTKFVYYWLLAHRREIIRLSEGAGQPNISQDVVRRLRIPAPDLHIQRRIASDLDQITEKASSLITKIGEVVSRLREYRAALITAAVTGQIDIPGAA